jgi:multidrug efflux pump subunit AcrA (membrane-fusion protein)
MKSYFVKIPLAIVVCVVAGYFLMPWFTGSGKLGADDNSKSLLVHTIKRETFESFITESGDIESIGSVEIKCEVKSEGRAGTTILKLVDEGTIVEEGDFLVSFDDSILQQTLTQQEILVATDERVVIDAESGLNTAEQTLNEYKEGLFLVDRETFESELLQAESQLKSTQDLLAHTNRMFRKGFVSQLQLEAEEVSVKMAEKNLQVAKTKLMVHNEFTLAKKISEYEAEIRKQKAALKAAESTLKLSQQRRDEIKEQIDKCQVLAPSAGQVVYANDFEKQTNVVIEAGALIRERQIMIRLPNPKEMQVRVRINDSKIKQIKAGNPVDIELDVNPDLRVKGKVAKINSFPYPRQWYGGPIEYGTDIRIEDPPPGLTPGQRAKVKIFVEKLENVVQVPVQSVVERSGLHYCLVRDAQGQWTTRKVGIGSNNGSFVVLKDGLEAGEEVALNPDLIWDDVSGELPAEETSAKKPKALATSK